MVLRYGLPAFILLFLAQAAIAYEGAPSRSGAFACMHQSISVRLDNDLFGGRGQDQGYTGGTVVTVVSPREEICADRGHIPRFVQSIAERLGRFHQAGNGAASVVFSLSQSLYTPEDHVQRELVSDDRPYAGIVLMAVGRNTRDKSLLVSTRFQFGVVGPLALGRQTQNLAHHALGNQKFEGWNHQLHNEPLFNLDHGRSRRWPTDARVNSGRWGWDKVVYWDGALGNRTTHLGSGIEVRFGWDLPDDFGSSPIRLTGEEAASRASAAAPRWSGHLFVTASGRWVLHDITLDGNTFRDSHDVDKRPFVGEVGYGVALRRGKLGMTVARYHGSREFDGQRELPVYGSLTIRYDL
ncbi:MAG: lipid A deacylase LpxR family protein [Pseudoxanthomonas sp.]